MQWVVIGTVCLLAACGASRPADTGSRVGLEEEIERSRDERPRWLGAPDCPAGKVCATGTRTRTTAVEHGRTDAYNDGLADFARRLGTKARSLFKKARAEGRLPDAGEAPEVDQAIKSFFAAASQLEVHDVQILDFWWRRYRALGADGRHRSYYDYSVHLGIDQAAWKRAVHALIDRERAKAARARQDALVKELDAFAADLVPTTPTAE